jgi:hypothetical protein
VLCDEVMVDLAIASGCDISAVVPRIARAQKFILTAEFAAVAEELSNDYTGLVRAFPQCRLPYADVWIEVLQADRPQFMASDMHMPQVQKKPKRVGFLLTAIREDLSAWKTHLFWSFDNHATGAAIAAVVYDMSQPIRHYTELPDDDDFDTDLNINGLQVKHFESHPGWVAASKQIRLVMTNHTTLAKPDFRYVFPGIELLDAQGLRDLAMITGRMARADWAGEGTFLLATIGLMNARNAVEIQAVDQSRLNKARIKSGKQPLLEHKILKIAHRQVKRVYPNGQRASNHAPMRGHFVRGHFKTRKSGIYFWLPHARGHFERGTITKDYKL